MGSCSNIEKNSDTIKYNSETENSFYNEDRLSSLPESVIHHILSLLPSTKDAARTAILSKSWRYKWHHVPNLIFLCRDYDVEDAQSFWELAQKALILYAGSQLEKFVIEFKNSSPKIKKLHPQISKLIQLATLKAVKEVILCVDDCIFELPQCFYNNTSLIKLKTRCFDFEPSGKVNWPSLKSLSIEGANLTNKFMENIISGSPLLESLELEDFGWGELYRLHIDSECLKRLALHWYGSNLRISGHSVEILEILIDGGGFLRVDIGIDLPSLVSCTINFWGLGEGEYKLVQGLVEQVMHAKELKLGMQCLKALPFLEAKAISGSDTEEQPSTLSNIECLMIEGSIFRPFSKYVPGIMSLLRISPKLVKLVINLFPWDECTIGQPDYCNISKNCLMQGNAIFTCLSSHLKTVEVIGLVPRFSRNVLGHQYKFSGPGEGVLEFLEFLLRNGSVLEKIIVMHGMHGRLNTTDFAVEASQWLLSIPRASPHVVIMFK